MKKKFSGFSYFSKAVLILLLIFAVFSGCTKKPDLPDLTVDLKSDLDKDGNIIELQAQAPPHEPNKSDDVISGDYPDIIDIIDNTDIIDITDETDKIDKTDEPEKSEETRQIIENVTESAIPMADYTEMPDLPAESAESVKTETQPPVTQTTQAPAQNQNIKPAEPVKPAPTNPPVIEVSSVNISKQNIAMYKNGTYSLTASVNPANATNQTLTWESSNPSVVSVKNGSLTALSAGSAVITVKSGNGKTAKCSVTVTVPVQSITVKIIPNQRQINKGAEFEAAVEIFPSDATDKSFTVYSSNENILKKSGGKWIACGVGTAKIIAKSSSSSGGVTGSAELTVIVPVESVKLEPVKKTVNRNDTFTLKPTVLPSDASDKTLTYKTSNKNVAVVYTDGTVYAAGAGTATVTCVSSNGIQASCEITVLVPVTSVSVELDKYKYKIGEKAKFKVIIYPADATDKSYSLSITGSGGAPAEDGSNSILCNSAGVTRITATASNGVSAKKSIEIIDLSEFVAEVLRLTNLERQNAGLSDLTTTDALNKTATVRAKELTVFYSHKRPDGRECFTAYAENNVSYFAAAENIAWGQLTPEEVVSDWMSSPKHSAHILNPKFNHIGIGIEIDANGNLCWSQDFTD